MLQPMGSQPNNKNNGGLCFLQIQKNSIRFLDFDLASQGEQWSGKTLSLLLFYFPGSPCSTPVLKRAIHMQLSRKDTQIKISNVTPH